jgi:hypothetical protein
VVDGVDEEGEAEDVGEEDEFLCFPSISKHIHLPLPLYLHILHSKEVSTYLSHIRTSLPHTRQEPYPRHPLLKAEPRLARKVVQVRDKALHDVLEAWVGALRVYAVHVLGDVFDCEVFEDGDRGLGALVGGHGEGFMMVWVSVMEKERQLRMRVNGGCGGEASSR